MFSKIKQLYEGCKNNLKIIIIAVLVSLAGLFLVVNWILPEQDNAVIEITQKNDVISSNYNEDTKTYNNPELIKQLQRKVIKRDSGLSVIILFRYLATMFIVLTFVGLGAWYLVTIYTNTKFTKADYAGDDGVLSEKERQAKMVVLASALLSTAIIASVLFNIFFG